MSSDFEHTLKMLGKQARQAEKARVEAEAAQRRREAETVDFAAAVGEVVPLKNTQRYAPPRDASPIKPRAKNEAARAEEDYFYVGTGGFDEPPATFSKNGQGQNDIRRLQSGHWPVVADVDLHGYTQEEAQQVLIPAWQHHVQQSQQSGSTSSLERLDNSRDKLIKTLKKSLEKPSKT